MEMHSLQGHIHRSPVHQKMSPRKTRQHTGLWNCHLTKIGLGKGHEMSGLSEFVSNLGGLQNLKIATNAAHVANCGW
jgi:hypothetical protein